MPTRLLEWYRRSGHFERMFVVALPVYLVLRLAAPDSGLESIFGLLTYVLGLVVAAKLAHGGIGRMMWRLRNRLIVAYLFIAVVPVALLLILFGLSGWWVTGQIAGYLVTSELERRTAGLERPAQILANIPAADREEAIRRTTSLLAQSFPKVAVMVGTPQEPLPEGLKNKHGVVLRRGTVYSWAHAAGAETEVTLLAPLTHDVLASLAPGLGVVDLLGGARIQRSQQAAGDRPDRIPPQFIAADLVVTGYYPLPCQVWDRPGTTENRVLVIQTRTSAVLGRVFGHSVVLEGLEWGEALWLIFVAISVLLLIVELISLAIGVSVTRTVTTAVNELYEGTERVRVGDFSHRIPVRGKDQIAVLAESFNTMTGNLERLIAVAKEKERLQSELEIAREVQTQLFPKTVPDLKGLAMAGVCNPARMVSGDYYDFMKLADSSLAFAIGDVAGKGISAALLMAAIQSTMRTQLNTASAPLAAAAGNGGRPAPVSTARLVSLLNKQLYANTSPEKYATFYFALYDDNTGSLTYTNAGHVRPVLVRHGQPSLLEVTGTVVGAFPFAEYQEQRMLLLPGDLLVTYTDGMVEPENEYGEMFGEQRLEEVLCRWADAPCDEVIARCMEAVNQWTGAGELQDDMTMLVARRL